MELLRWKTRLAVLWIIQAVAFAAVHLMDPKVWSGVKGTLLEVPALEQTRMLISIFFFIPCIMAWFSMTLKDSANRWLSFVLGILYALLKLVSFISALTGGGSTSTIFNESWGSLAAILIVWYAWKMPKQEA
jgi:hypothetical protein